MPEDRRRQFNNQTNGNENEKRSHSVDRGITVSSGKPQPDDNLLRHVASDTKDAIKDTFDEKNKKNRNKDNLEKDRNKYDKDNKKNKDDANDIEDYNQDKGNNALSPARDNSFNNVQKNLPNNHNQMDSNKTNANMVNKKNEDVISHGKNPIQKNAANRVPNNNINKKSNDGIVKDAGKKLIFGGMNALLPGLGKAAEVADNAKKKKKKKEEEKKENEDKNKKSSDSNSNEKKDDKSNNSDKQENNSSTSRIFGKMSLAKKAFLFAIPIVIFLMIAIPVLLMNVISNFALEFASSFMRLEPLTELFPFDSKDTNAEYEKAYIDNLADVYESKNKSFNPDYVSATMAVMKDNSQYAEDGQYGYSDFIPKSGVLGLIGVYDKSNIEELADIFSKIKETSATSSNNTTTNAVSGDVASDAGTMVGSGHSLGESYVPNVIDTGRVGLGKSCQLTQEAWDAFQNMERGAASQGVTIGVNSCYRSYAEQAVTVGNSPASAGYSEHQLGSTIDIADHDNGYINNETVLRWLDDHSTEYGFVRSLTTMGNERHHYRYVGTKVASAFKNYINNGGVNYLTFQDTEEGKSVIGGGGNTSSSSNTSSSNSNSSSNNSSSTVNAGVEMVKRAQQEIDYTEQPGGVTKYGEWFGMPSAEWCAIFIAWLANQVGVPEDVIPKDGAVVTMQSFYQSKGLYHPVSDTSYQPKPGDLIFYNHPHVGLVEEYTNGNLKTIEGNASITVDRVIEKDGPEWFGDVAGFASPNYGNVAASSSSNNSDGVQITGEDSEEVRNALKEFLKHELPKTDGKEEVLDSLVDQIFRHKRSYYDFIGKKVTDECSDTVTSSAGSCTYQFNGIRDEGLSTNDAMTVSNLKVRLMECKSSNPQPLENEELVDFEKYVLGVTYGEVGEEAPTEAAKAQAIATRSFSLARPTIMGNFVGTRFVEENGQTILQLRSCTMDQVYCDPDRGCVKDGGANSEVHSGTTGGVFYKGPLAADNPLRAAVAATNGQILLDSGGRVVYANYWDTDQRAWSSAAQSGKSVTEILVSHYKSSDAASLSTPACDGASVSSSSNNPNCPTNTNSSGNAASGDYANWKQCDDRWGGEGLGNRTICSIGCTATSMAMLIAKSGVPTNVTEEFNPGSFVRAMKNAGGFDGSGNFNWSVTPKVVPSYQDAGFSSYSPSDVAAKTSQGYSGVIWVGKAGRSCHHWVAVDRVENGVVFILDPAGDNGPVDTTYPNKCGVHYFKLK